MKFDISCFTLSPLADNPAPFPATNAGPYREMPSSAREMSIRRSPRTLTTFGLALLAGGLAHAQTTTYTYTGNPYDPAWCSAFPGVLSCPAGNITASFTFNIPSGYTGEVTGSSQIATYTATASGVGISFTPANSSFIELAVDPLFTFQNGTITMWLFQLQDSTQSKVITSTNVSPMDVAWNYTVLPGLFGKVQTSGTWAFGNGSSSGPPVPDKSLGAAGNGTCPCGDPITIGTGNVFEQVTDYATAGPNKLQFTRAYNSFGNTSSVKSFATTLGVNWRHNYDRYLHVTTSNGAPAAVVAERADGQMITFTLSNGVWTSDSDIDYILTRNNSTWTLTDHNDTVETYVVDSSGQGLLTSVAARNGYNQSLVYAGSQLQTVTDSFGRVLSFSYGNGRLSGVTTPEPTTITFGFNSSGSSTALDRLSSVTYPTNPQATLSYGYGNTALPYALTSVTDENGSLYAQWTYDSQSRGTSSQLAGGANLTTVTYGNSGTVTVTNAFGVADTYTFSNLQGTPKISQVARAATATTAAATRKITYDGNGFLASQTDWNGNLTTYVNDVHGQPTSITEAAGTPQARTTTITYHPSFHLPLSIVTPGLTTTFTYDSSGEVLTKTETDTTQQ